MYIDTHAHIFKQFFEFPDKIILDSKEKGIFKIINIGTNLLEAIELIELRKKYPEILYSALGIHPENAASSSFEEIDIEIKKFEDIVKLNRDKIIALGEFGLDYKFLEGKNINEVKKKQLILFKSQLDIAYKFNFPIIIHCRDAMDDLYRVLQEYHNQGIKFKGVIHSIDGPLQTIEKIIELGFYLSFNGILTFKNATEINKLAQEIDIKHIILETDAPFLAPVPVRGTQNIPSNIIYIYKYLADLKSIEEKEIQERIKDNLNKLFKLKI